MIPKIVRDLFESASTVQDYLEETLLSMHEEFGEYVGQFVDKWRESIDHLIPYVENPADQLERALSDLSIKLECWEYYRDLGTAFAKVQSNLKSSPFYLEMICKLFRRMLENGVDAKLLVDNIASVTEQPAEHVKVSTEIRDLQIAAISGDIEFYPASLQYLIDERETNKQGNDEAINIFEQYFSKKTTFDQLLQNEHIPEYGIGSLSL
jgi:golgin subfamily B member 1